MASPDPARRAVVVITADSTLQTRLQSALARADLDLHIIDSSHPLPAASPQPPLLVLIDLRHRAESAVRLAEAWRTQYGASLPLVVVAESVESAADARALHAVGVTGYLSASTEEGQIMPALAPWLYPDNFNRRSHPRLEISLPVSYRSADTVAAALTRNIGSGGMAVRTTQPLAPETSVAVSIRLPGHANELTVEARVCWRAPGAAMGLTFTRVSAEAQAAIDTCVGTRLPASGH
jgi:uncharacterized protein (TIGR02266 family)